MCVAVETPDLLRYAGPPPGNLAFLESRVADTITPRIRLNSKILRNRARYPALYLRFHKRYGRLVGDRFNAINGCSVVYLRFVGPEFFIEVFENKVFLCHGDGAAAVV